jgi:hypothetical protein
MVPGIGSLHSENSKCQHRIHFEGLILNLKERSMMRKISKKCPIIINLKNKINKNKQILQIF